MLDLSNAPLSRVESAHCILFASENIKMASENEFMRCRCRYDRSQIPQHLPLRIC